MESQGTQILLGWHVSFFVWIVILISSFWVTSRVIDYLIRNEKLSRLRAERLVIKLDFVGTFVLVFALSAISAGSFDSIEYPFLKFDTVGSAYNPMFGIYILFISYKLKLAINKGKIQ